VRLQRILVCAYAASIHRFLVETIVIGISARLAGGERNSDVRRALIWLSGTLS